MSQILYPLGWAYWGTTTMRNWLYDRGLKKSNHVAVPVISIGNLTVGGTGKTPVTLALIKILKEKGLKCGVVSRGYKRKASGIHFVELSPKAAHQFGDEPTLIKESFPEVPVVVGEKRFLAAQALLAKEKVDLILCDDAFQHRTLFRDLNIVLIDATESTRNYRILPVGRARESLVPALGRADFIVITKSNLVSREELHSLKDWLEAKTLKPILMAEYRLNGFRSFDGEFRDSLVEPAILVSGIAKPRALEQTLGDRAKIVKHKCFPDHHHYRDLEIEIMLDEAAHLGARWILTTAKDATKLRLFKKLRDRLWIANLELKFSDDEKGLYEAIFRLAR